MSGGLEECDVYILHSNKRRLFHIENVNYFLDLNSKTTKNIAPNPAIRYLLPNTL